MFKEVIVNTQFLIKMTEKNYCWEIHLPRELILPARAVIYRRTVLP
jgi:hypothetical protein